MDGKMTGAYNYGQTTYLFELQSEINNEWLSIITVRVNILKIKTRINMD